VSLGVTVIAAILARSDYQLIKIQWFAKQIPRGSRSPRRSQSAVAIAMEEAEGVCLARQTPIALARGQMG
jgi:hypothetical protein